MFLFELFDLRFDLLRLFLVEPVIFNEILERFSFSELREFVKSVGQKSAVVTHFISLEILNKPLVHLFSKVFNAAHAPQVSDQHIGMTSEEDFSP